MEKQRREQVVAAAIRSMFAQSTAELVRSGFTVRGTEVGRLLLVAQQLRDQQKACEEGMAQRAQARQAARTTGPDHPIKRSTHPDSLRHSHFHHTAARERVARRPGTEFLLVDNGT